MIKRIPWIHVGRKSSFTDRFVAGVHREMESIDATASLVSARGIR